MTQAGDQAVLVASAPGQGAAVQVVSFAQAAVRGGCAPGASPQDLARGLRTAGAHAVLVLDAGRAWLDAPHASGSATGMQPVDTPTLVQRWTQFLAHGFVAADAALLALWTEHEALPTFTWGDAAAVPVTGRMPPLGLYAIVDDVPRLRQVLDAGVGTVQLRIKQPLDADSAWFAALRASLREGVAAARDAGATLVVNDHWRIAADLGAPAVHLGQEDLGRLAGRDLAELGASGMALGISSHAVWELCRARALAPAYIACGPVWPTTTKDMPWRPQGLDNLAWWCRHAQHPVVAIGGILGAAQVRDTARAGAAGVCVLRGLSDDPRQVVPALQDAFAQGRAEHDAAAAPRWPHPSLEATA
ncbi:MAG: thiamine phosphate synthase [Ramlibacter sp.]